MNITKIVVTGGPCAGKSTAMSWIQNVSPGIQPYAGADFLFHRKCGAISYETKKLRKDAHSRDRNILLCARMSRATYFFTGE